VTLTIYIVTNLQELLKKWIGGIKRMTGISAGEIVMLAIGFFLVAILAPIAMSEIVGANTTGWPPAVTTIFTILLPILFIIGVAIHYIPGKRE